MALTGSQKAYLQARSGIARSGAIRSNYVFPLYGVITVGGLDLTAQVQYGTLRITQQINDQPDTASFDVMLTSSAVQTALTIGAEVLIGLGGPSANALFGGRILTTQTRRGPARTPSVVSVMCADYLQVLDSEYLVTYDWPGQSATTTILDLVARFANKPGGVTIATSSVSAALPSHGQVGVSNERISTVLNRLVTMFPSGGGFYVDPLKVLHVWAGASEPNLVSPQTLTLDNPTLKAFAETVDGKQIRNAVIVEGRRTTAPIGSPGPNLADPSAGDAFSVPVIDASIIDPIKLIDGVMREVRIGTQRFTVRLAEGIWSAPAGTPQVTQIVTDVPFDPAGSGPITIPIASTDLFTARNIPWVRVDEQYLQILGFEPHYGATGAYMIVPRTGYGALIGPIKAGAAVTVVDNLEAMYVTDRYNAGTREQVRPQPIGSDVVMTERSATGIAINEQLVQDGRYVRAGALARGQREIGDFSAPLVSIDFETDDMNALPGRLVAYDFADPGLAPMQGEFMILSTEIVWPVWGQPPRRQCHGATVRVANVVDTWLIDPR